jgi:hypothetical protein
VDKPAELDRSGLATIPLILVAAVALRYVHVLSHVASGLERQADSDRRGGIGRRARRIEPRRNRPRPKGLKRGGS